ncbi:NAD(P)-dependent oxidoreductase [Porticoccaceae bacterium]|nr:NAD(P)-dependent oxidoreductase [Porticoccaceae bacterium]MBT7259231.1 NAD(P)-dependent oxidoreductase [Porticoccaceae bacterium]MDA7816364.1 NAD(P)-dependent oxidoreductase [Porticoccaceae bacterium]MDA8902681.1 NAD(P)-dependent oxidoreductase [Porticoccaceae bacterium]MDA8920204.1 NAD(P)-dependent oxidoreductase [Porticoccaceae bacterium]
MAAARIAFIGLGVMGYPMAGWLSSKGHSITVYNRTGEVAERWVSQHSGDLAQTPQQAAAAADIIFTCVGNDNDLSEVLMGEQGVMAGIKQGALLVDHTTTSAELAKQIDVACRAANCGFVDAPVSGGQQGAENGQLTVMCGGDPEHFAEVQPLLACYAKEAQLMGPSGSGQLCKMVNQICIAGLVQGLAEGLNFAQRAGLDAHQVIQVISKGAAQSWQMENRHKTMLAGEYDHGFAVEWMRKDLSYALAEAKTNGAELPVTELVDQYYAQVQELGGNRWDTSSLLARLVAQNNTGTDNKG